jgi:hypothetical protein
MLRRLLSIRTLQHFHKKGMGTLKGYMIKSGNLQYFQLQEYIAANVTVLVLLFFSARICFIIVKVVQF